MRLEVVKVVKVVAKLETFGNNIGIKFCARLEDIKTADNPADFNVAVRSISLSSFETPFKMPAQIFMC